ncbi:MAG: M23 family metallopeptidase [Dehalococcoidia bacterium]|nr:M23 family metallopeptidase [Dehalococcoidia bacterium]
MALVALVALIIAGVIAVARAGGGSGASERAVSAVPRDATAAPAAGPLDTATPAPAAAPASAPSPAAGASATPTPALAATPAPAASASATPTASPDAGALTVPAQLGTGETIALRLRAPGAVSATVQFRGASYPLITLGEEFGAVLGVPLEAALGPAQLTVSALDGAGGAPQRWTAAYEVVDRGREVDHVALTDEVAAVLTPDASARESALRVTQFARSDPAPAWAGRFQVPIPGVVSSGFGVGRSYNNGPVGGFHGGLDLAADAGTTVLAPAAGRVSWVGAMPIRGLSVIVDHGAGVQSGYHHLGAAFVTVGQAVAPGQPLGLVGSSGFATGPHLHWEVTIWGVNVDPSAWTATGFLR